MKIIEISLLSASPEQLAHMPETIGLIESTAYKVQRKHNHQVGFAWHLDIMDGQYVKQIAFCPQFLTQVAMLVTLPTELHFMTMHMHQYQQGIDAFDKLSTSVIVRKFAHIGTNTIEMPGFGVTFNPEESIDGQCCRVSNNILLMSVHPGLGGQSYISVASKIKEVRAANSQAFIVVDGGINPSTIEDCREADAFVIGSAAMKAATSEELLTKFFEQCIDGMVL